jgi:Animal haem peroxidase
MHGRAAGPILAGASKEALGSARVILNGGVAVPDQYPALLNGPETTPEPYRGVLMRDGGGADIRLTEALVEQLAIRMDGNIRRGEDDGSFNKAIPSGYTYLAQFAAHDMTMNSRAAASLFSPPAQENLRSRALMLDTLYGTGPQTSPHCHAWPEDPGGMPVHLRLEPVRVGSRAGPLRDIGRMIGNSGGLVRSIPLIADARNDDNAVISQITVLFAMAHNAAVGKMPRNWEAEERYLGARLALTAAFRSVLRNDLVRRLVEPDTFAWYEAGKDDSRFLSKGLKRRPVSAEFAHAVCRMGHAMVRPEYRFNMRSGSHPLASVIERNSLKRPRDMPFDREWIAQWSLFFDLGRREPQPSMLIGPGYAGPLIRAFKHPKDSEGGGLARRDLLRGAVSGVSTLAHLRGRIGALAPADYPNRAWLLDAARHRAIVRQWLEDSSRALGHSGGLGKMPKALAEAAVNDPPLGLFVLIEASQKPWSGKSLGPLGSMIAAETFFHALEDESSLGTLMPQTGFGAAEAVKAVFGPAPQTMPALIRWLDRNLPETEKRLPGGSPLPLV